MKPAHLLVRVLFKFAVYLAVFICFSGHAATPEVAFFRAVNVDDERTVRSLLAQGLDPNLRSPQGEPGLVLAMKDGSPKVAAVLLDHPAILVDATTAAGETALMLAALRGRLDWVQRLAQRGAALQRPGWSPLHYACSGPDGLDVARYLLEQGVPIDARSPNGSTPLMMAARYGSDETAEWLLKRGADVRLRNDRGLQAQDFAKLGGRERLAAALAEPAAR